MKNSKEKFSLVCTFHKSACILIFILGISFNTHGFTIKNDSTSTIHYDSLTESLYHALGNEDLSFDAFSYAYHGYQKLIAEHVVDKKDILTVIDFNKSSKEDRFFVIDLQKHKIIHESLVAHGKNSGWDIPESFSNMTNSLKSSLGFFLTGETYQGKHGLSLKLDGLEKGINDNARERNIVIHSADYVSESFIDKVGRLGRSFGCPSLPVKNYTEVIDIIKERSLIFIFSNQLDYFKTSKFL